MNQLEDSKTRLIKLLTSLGDAQMEQNNYTGAIEHYERILSLGIEEPIVYSALSKAYVRLNRLDTKAINIHRKTLQFDARNKEVCDVLTDFYLSQKRADNEAIAVLTQSLNLNSQHVAKIIPALIKIYLEQSNIDSAIKIAEKGLVFPDYQSVALKYFIELSLKNNRFDHTLEVLKVKYQHLPIQDILIGIGRVLVEKQAFLAKQGNPLFLTVEECELSYKLLKMELALQQIADVQFINTLSLLIFQSYENQQQSQKVEDSEFQFFFKNIHPKTIIKQGFSGKNFEYINIDFFEILWERLNKGPNDLPSPNKRLLQQVMNTKQQLVGIAIRLKNPRSGPDYSANQKGQKTVTQCLSTLADQLARKNKFLLRMTVESCLALTSWYPELTNDIVELLRGFEKGQQKSPATERIEISVSMNFLPNLENQVIEFFKNFSILLEINEINTNGKLNENNRLLISEQFYQEIKKSLTYQFEDLGKYALKYHIQPAAVYHLDWVDPLARLKTGMLKKLGRFEILEELDSSEFYSVYKGRDNLLERMVLIKAVRNVSSRNPKQTLPLTDAFTREAREVSKLNHRNIILVYDVGEEAGFYYVAREYFEGQNLHQLAKNFDIKDLKRLVRIFIQICTALKFAHQQNIFHKNLKPTNIILSSQDEVKVTDFGGVSSQIKAEVNKANWIDTLNYQPPEQIAQNLIDFRADIYAVGVILYEFLLKRRPLDSDELITIRDHIKKDIPQLPSELNPELNKMFDKIIINTLSRNPNARYPNIQYVIQDLYEIIK
jgi:tRNA A-37 threonylcarbamoyl transferase component Bud32